MGLPASSFYSVHRNTRGRADDHGCSRAIFPVLGREAAEMLDPRDAASTRHLWGRRLQPCDPRDAGNLAIGIDRDRSYPRAASISSTVPAAG